ncbi:MAG: PilZ domain-containing protein [Rhodospirillales bacterium]|nr:PilZ domain-containing protein [Rhodospirillales bacterium]
MAYGDKFGGFARTNRRKDIRRAVACRILTGRGQVLGTTKDLSMGGLALGHAVPGLACGSEIPVHLQAPNGHWVALRAKVLRNGQGGGDCDFALQFRALSPQAFSDLERIMVAPMRAQA